MEDQAKVRCKALAPFNHGAIDAKKGDVVEVSADDAEKLYKAKLIERVPNEPADSEPTERVAHLGEQGKDGSGIISNAGFPDHATKAAPPHENK